MKTTKQPQYYLEYAQSSSATNSQEDALQHIEEIKYILEKMDKGIEILNSMGRRPEQSVLDNRVKLVKALEILTNS